MEEGGMEIDRQRDGESSRERERLRQSWRKRKNKELIEKQRERIIQTPQVFVLTLFPLNLSPLSLLLPMPPTVSHLCFE